MTDLGDPVRLGNLSARNRLVFGPHVTNLARGRRISERHVAYYRARAAGGAGLVVTEEASVDHTDWPYERAPLAAACAEGWSLVAGACHGEGSLCVAALGHAGGQGSSAYHQRALLAPSSVPDVVTREVPKAMEDDEIAALVAAFGSAAALAVASGCDGVEVNAGQWSLLRQFCSGLTNQRADAYGSDRALLLRQVLDAVRSAAAGAVVGLRFSCDELAPWAGIVPEAAAGVLTDLAAGDRFDYVAVVRGSAYGTGAMRPDGHVSPGFNRDTTALVRRALPAGVAVVAQGSIVDVAMASEVVGSGEADLVEMTRALIADHALGNKVAAGEPGRIRPCTLCNQVCQVRDPRNPLVSCTSDPSAGHESEEPEPPSTRAAEPVGVHLLVVGGGPAGLECARVAALRGFDVTVLEREHRLGGMAVTVGKMPGRQRFGSLVEWLEAECRLAGVELVTGHEATLEALDAHEGPVVCCTGSRDGRRPFAVAEFATVITAAEVLLADRVVGELVPSPVVVYDPVGGPIGVAAAELLATLGVAVTLITPDFVVGEQLAMSGDLAPAAVRLQQAGVRLVKRTIVRSVEPEHVVVENRDSGETSSVAASVVIDAGYRLPEDTLARAALATRPDVVAAGDAVAPRTVLEAILEGRRAATALVPKQLAPGSSGPRGSSGSSGLR